ncbi:hypothetical protein FWK35_00010057 [Aphis craccivora]|uniref:Uncharacterized protein n=1 Tax=Aphis craccivora TaxID=307492 RepID=A0A6G0ZLF4_APHCR|nr:hypothetical protein FWK35_00010057 [Aphis craccivora]
MLQFQILGVVSYVKMNIHGAL